MAPIFLVVLLAQSPAPPVVTVPFHGRVVRAEDGAPIEGATAEVRWNRGKVFVSRSHGTPRRETLEPPPFPSVESDADGRFRIDFDPTKAPWIVVAAKGRGAGACGSLAGHADPQRAVELALTRAARLELRLDAFARGGSEDALAEIRVEAPLHASSFPPWLGVIARDESHVSNARVRPFGPSDPPGLVRDAAQKLVLDELPAGVPLELFVALPGDPVGKSEPMRLVLEPGESRWMTWPPKPRGGGRVRVEVRDEHGNPLAGAPVLIGRGRGGAVANFDRERARRDVADASGMLRQADLNAGRWVFDLGDELCSAAVGIELGVATEALVSLRAEPARQVAGRVVDAGGEPVANAWVWFTRGRDHDGIEDDARTGSDGSFVLRGIPRDVLGRLHASSATVADLEVDLVETAAVAGPIEIRFPPLVPLRVRTFDAAGAPFAAQLRHGPSYALGALWRVAQSVEHDLSLPPGPRRVTALSTEGLAASAVVDVGRAKELDLRLAPAGSVRLRHRGLAELLDVVLEDERGFALGVTTLRSGVDEVVLAPPGEWTVRAAARPTRTIRVAAGVETLVEL